MDVSWQNLPRDIMHLILKFDGSIVYRKGQYIPRISPADPRYDMLLTQRPLPQIMPSGLDEIIDITVPFIRATHESQGGSQETTQESRRSFARFSITITSIYDDEDQKMYRWICYSYLPPLPRLPTIHDRYYSY